MWSSHSQVFIFLCYQYIFPLCTFFLMSKQMKSSVSFSQFRNFKSHESRRKTNKLEVSEMRSRDIDLITKLCTLTWLSESLKRQTWTLETKRCWTIKRVSATFDGLVDFCECRTLTFFLPLRLSPSPTLSLPCFLPLVPSHFLSNPNQTSSTSPSHPPSFRSFFTAHQTQSIWWLLALLKNYRVVRL